MTCSVEVTHPDRAAEAVGCVFHNDVTRGPVRNVDGSVMMAPPQLMLEARNRLQPGDQFAVDLPEAINLSPGAPHVADRKRWRIRPQLVDITHRGRRIGDCLRLSPEDLRALKAWRATYP